MRILLTKDAFLLPKLRTHHVKPKHLSSCTLKYLARIPCDDGLSCTLVYTKDCHWKVDVASTKEKIFSANIVSEMKWNIQLYLSFDAVCYSVGSVLLLVLLFIADQGFYVSDMITLIYTKQLVKITADVWFTVRAHSHRTLANLQCFLIHTELWRIYNVFL